MLQCGVKTFAKISISDKISKMAALETYHSLIKKLIDQYHLKVYQEHEFIFEFFEGDLPLFKLIFGRDDEKAYNKIVLSFHLETSVVDAIQWYVKVTNWYADTRLTDSYFKDDSGESYIGQDAEILRRYKMEQEVVSSWLDGESDEEDARDFATSKIRGRIRERGKSFSRMDDAIREFNMMAKGDHDDEYH